MAVFDSIQHCEVAERIGTVLNAEDISSALSRIANGKSGGLSGTVPKLLKAGGSSLQAALVDLIQSAWLSLYAPTDWQNEQLVPVPKKRDISCCGNWGSPHCTRTHYSTHSVRLTNTWINVHSKDPIQLTV